MSIHVPAFMVDKNRKGKNKFIADVKADLRATIEFLYERKMWSRFHYEKWMDALNEMTDEVYLHGWWDSVVAGAMYEVDEEDLREMQHGLAGKCGGKWKQD